MALVMAVWRSEWLVVPSPRTPRSAVGLLDDTPDGAQAQALPEAESPVAALRAELEATAREDDEMGASSGNLLPFWSKETKV